MTNMAPAQQAAAAKRRNNLAIRLDTLRRLHQQGATLDEAARHIGVERTYLMVILRKHLPELHPKKTAWVPDAKKPTATRGDRRLAGPSRSFQWQGSQKIEVIPTLGSAYVGCGPCGRAFRRDTVRKAEKLAELHARMHSKAARE